MRHKLPYFSFCGVVIALLVFLNAAQPFVLSEVLGLLQNGAASGMLALVDEVVSLVLAPFWGALSDKVGTRYVATLSLWIMLISLYFYPRVNTLVPGLLVTRGVFALGASGAVAMITAGLAELSMLVLDEDLAVGNDSSIADSSPDRMLESVISGESLPDGDETVPLFEASGSEDELFSTVAGTQRPNGKLSGMVGFTSGIGALFAVGVLLPLPTRFSGGAEGLREAFKIVAIGGLGVSIALLFTMYQNPARGVRSFLLGSENVSIFDEAALDAGGSVISYLELLKDGFLAARNDRRLTVAYLGSMIARAASVLLSLFIPLWVNQWFRQGDRCTSDSCHNAIVRAAILTGMANSSMLVAAPFVGIAGDRFGAVTVLAASSALGVASMFLFVTIDSPLSGWAIIASVVLGVAQIGCTITSMSMSTDKRRVSPGSVAGVYSLMGSLGILLITQLGGPLADRWSRSPFLVMLIIFALLVVASYRLRKQGVLRSMRSFTSLR